MSASAWDVLKRAEACAACSAPFSPLQEAWTRLAASGAELRRSDFCDPCWRREAADPGALYWKGRVPAPQEKPREVFDAQELFGMLERLLEEDDPARDRICYLVALYCCRKRLIRLRGIERKAEGEVLVFTKARTRTEMRVRSVELGPAELASAREEMAKLAESGA